MNELLYILFSMFFPKSNGASNPMELPLALIFIFWSSVQMFVFCDLGERVSDQFSQVDNAIYFCDWYKFPKEMQRMLPIIMISSQEPVTLTGFANLSCTREAFKKVDFSNTMPM